MKPQTNRIIGSISIVTFALCLPAICNSQVPLAEEHPVGFLHIWGDEFFEGRVRGSEPTPREIGPVTSFSTRWTERNALRADGSVLTWTASEITEVERAPGQAKIVSLHESFYGSYALREDGQLVDWPEKDYSALGAPSEATGIQQIAAGRHLVLGLKEDGSVIRWGFDINPPFRLPDTLIDVAEIAAGSLQYIALKEDGRVIPFRLGNSDPILPPSPLSSVRAVAAGERHFVALLEDGSIRAWNREGWISGIPSDPMGIVEIAAAGFHTVARTQTGKLLVWGAPPELQPSIPDGVSVSAIFTSPNYIAVLAEQPFPVLDTPLTNIAVQPGQAATFSSRSGNKSPLSFEWYKDGNLILGETESRLHISNADSGDAGNYTVTVRDPDGATVSSTASLAVVAAPFKPATRGRVRDWGYRAPLWEVGDNDFVRVAAGFEHTLFLRPDGTVVAAGRNYEGQADVPPNLPRVIELAAGHLHSLAITEAGKVVAWGSNRAGQSEVPKHLDGVTAVAAGSRHSVALREDGLIVAWGDNSSGQTDIPGELTDVIAIDAGAHHTLALSRDGTVAAWGRNRRGQTDVPTLLQDVVAIAAGGDQSVALRSDGTMITWGSTSAFQKMHVESLHGVTAIAASKDRIGYILADHNVEISPRIATDPLGADTIPLTIDAGFYHFYVIESHPLLPGDQFQMKFMPGPRSLDGRMPIQIHDASGSPIPLSEAQELVIESRRDFGPESQWDPIEPEFDRSLPRTGTFWLTPESSQSFFRVSPQVRIPDRNR